MSVRAGITRDSGRLWVAFPETPDDSTRATLRAHNLTWHTIQRRWMTPRGEKVTAKQIRAVYLLTGCELWTHREKSIEKSVDAFGRLGVWLSSQPPADLWVRRWQALDNVHREWASVVTGNTSWHPNPFVDIARWARWIAAELPDDREFREARDRESRRFIGCSRRYRQLHADLASIQVALSKCGGGIALWMFSTTWPGLEDPDDPDVIAERSRYFCRRGCPCGNGGSEYRYHDPDYKR